MTSEDESKSIAIYKAQHHFQVDDIYKFNSRVMQVWYLKFDNNWKLVSKASVWMSQSNVYYLNTWFRHIIVNAIWYVLYDSL